MTTLIVFLIDRQLVRDTGMYMFDMNQLYNWLIMRRLVRRFRSNMYIPVSHTNRRSIQNTIGLVMNHLVGIGLKVANANLVSAGIWA